MTKHRLISIKRIFISLTFILFLFIPIHLSAQVSIWDGTYEKWNKGNGSSKDPFLIEKAQHLAYLAHIVNTGEGANSSNCVMSKKFFKLTVDIDLNGSSGKQWLIIGNYEYSFGGFFEGNNHTISDIYIEIAPSADHKYIGLFGSASGGSIKNLRILDGEILTSCGNAFIGGLVGKSGNLTITNCHNGANISATSTEYNPYIYAAGIVGFSNGTHTMSNCSNSGSIHVDCFAAGIIGKSYCSSITINDCFNAGEISSRSGSGGIAYSINSNYYISGCYNSGRVSSKGSSAGLVTELVAAGNKSENYVIACYNSGDIAKTSTTDGYIVAGLIAKIELTSERKGFYTNNYNIGTITKMIMDWGTTKAAFVGKVERNSYATHKFIYNYYVNTCNAIDYEYYADSLTSTEMKDKHFVYTLNQELSNDMWKYDYNSINNGYPVLIWQDGEPVACDEPTNLSIIAVEKDEATFSWDGQALEFIIQYCPAGETNFYSKSTTENQITIKNLTPGTEYVWKVQAICGIDSESDFAVGDNFYTKDDCANPINLSATSVEKTVAQLAWEGNANEFVIQYCQIDETNFKTKNTTENQITIENLIPDTEYTWKVKAICDINNESNFVIGPNFTTKNDGIINLESEKISIYPNPTTGKLFIQLNNSDFNKINIHIINLHGKKVMNFYENKTEIDISPLPSGMYILRIVNERGLIIDNKKIIKQ